uniref:Uncharacterized protein n=1 Tax=Equus asinus asinus TaxID=83772 RepID=A0A8C4KYE5_EQUAS
DSVRLESCEIPESRVFQIFQIVLISQGPSSIQLNINIYICWECRHLVPFLGYIVQLYEYFILHFFIY